MLVNRVIAPNRVNQRESAVTPASRSSWLRRVNLSFSMSSCANALTTRMPDRDSFRCVWKRAHFWPTRWNSVDIGFQKAAASTITIGTGARMHRVSAQLVRSRKTATPSIIRPLVTMYGTPSTRKPQTRSVSWVTRLVIAPTCFLSK